MDKTQALQTVINAMKVANKRGAFELEESAQIFAALQILSTPDQPEAKMGIVAKEGKDAEKK